MKKIYDVYFKPMAEAIIAIEAENEDDATNQLFNMSNRELLSRISDAIDFFGIEVVGVTEVDY